MVDRRMTKTDGGSFVALRASAAGLFWRRSNSPTVLVHQHFRRLSLSLTVRASVCVCVLGYRCRRGKGSLSFLRGGKGGPFLDIPGACRGRPQSASLGMAAFALAACLEELRALPGGAFFLGLRGGFLFLSLNLAAGRVDPAPYYHGHFRWYALCSRSNTRRGRLRGGKTETRRRERRVRAAASFAAVRSGLCAAGKGTAAWRNTFFGQEVAHEGACFARRYTRTACVVCFEGEATLYNFVTGFYHRVMKVFVTIFRKHKLHRKKKLVFLFHSFVRQVLTLCRVPAHLYVTGPSAKFVRGTTPSYDVNTYAGVHCAWNATPNCLPCTVHASQGS